MPKDSFFSVVLRAQVERVAAQNKLSEQLRPVIYESARLALGLLAGERVPDPRPRLTLVPLKRDAHRQQRIQHALKRGDAVADIARREQVSDRYVRRIRALLARQQSESSGR